MAYVGNTPTPVPVAPGSIGPGAVGNTALEANSVTADKIAPGAIETDLGYVPVTPTALSTGLGTKQDSLVSGTSIKTINSTSILGSGDLMIVGTPDFVLFSQGII